MALRKNYKVTIDETSNKESEYKKPVNEIINDLIDIQDVFEQIFQDTVGNTIIMGVSNLGKIKTLDLDLNNLEFDSINKNNILRRLRKFVHIDKQLKIMFYDTDLEFMKTNIVNFWDKTIWNLIVDYKHKTMSTLIYERLEALKSDEIDIELIVFLRIANPTFKYYCKNTCGVDIDPSVKLQCEKLYNLIHSLHNNKQNNVEKTDLEKKVFLDKFDNHIFFAFNCVLLGKKKRNIFENQSGGSASAKYKYKGRSYKLRTGVRGGKYILVDTKKIYI